MNPPICSEVISADPPILFFYYILKLGGPDIHEPNFQEEKKYPNFPWLTAPFFGLMVNM